MSRALLAKNLIGSPWRFQSGAGAWEDGSASVAFTRPAWPGALALFGVPQPDGQAFAGRVQRSSGTGPLSLYSTAADGTDAIELPEGDAVPVHVGARVISQATTIPWVLGCRFYDGGGSILGTLTADPVNVAFSFQTLLASFDPPVGSVTANLLITSSSVVVNTVGFVLRAQLSQRPFTVLTPGAVE